MDLEKWRIIKIFKINIRTYKKLFINIIIFYFIT